MSAGLAYQLRDLTKEYAGRRVLDVPALDVPWGDILGIVGPSGAGKSTLLRLLNLLEAPTSGEICFAGTVVPRPETAPLALRRRVVTVFQRPVLLSGSVAANVAYGLQVRGERDIRARVDASLAQVGLAHLARAAVRTLSGGELQRVALTRALVVRPDVLLLDEPTANLDPAHVASIENVIRAAHDEHGTTIILVTHNIFQARRLAQRAALLVGGRLVEVAPTAEFFDRPKSETTRAFVNGEMVY
jgi:tungstate transport system ATP-binding protein